MKEQTVRIVLVRHGRTAWNSESPTDVRFRGQADLELDGFGLRQAAATGRYVARRWPVHAVYASPMKRAVETARAIAEAHGLTVQAFEGLLDIDFGHWQGRSLKQVEKEYPHVLRDWFRAPHTVQVPGGESLDDVQERVVAGLGIILPRHRGETVAMVGHSVVNRVFLCAVLGLGNDYFWRLRQSTCGVSVLEFPEDRAATVEVLNDTSHLQDI